MIRKFERRDAEPVMEIWLEGNLEAHGFIPGEYWKSHMQEVREQLLQAEVYVAEKEGAVCGFAGLQGEYLAGIFVKKEFRRAGLGKELLDHIKARRPVLTLSVYKKNRPAEAFYEREGFAVLSEGIDPDTGEAEAEMRWRYSGEER